MAKKFDESKVSRDDDGKFGSGGGGGAKKEKKGEYGGDGTRTADKSHKEMKDRMTSLTPRQYKHTISALETTIDRLEKKNLPVPDAVDKAKAELRMYSWAQSIAAGEDPSGYATKRFEAAFKEVYGDEEPKRKKSKNSIDLFHNKQYQTGKARYGS